LHHACLPASHTASDGITTTRHTRASTHPAKTHPQADDIKILRDIEQFYR
jgi:hypothetical protein